VCSRRQSDGGRRPLKLIVSCPVKSDPHVSSDGILTNAKAHWRHFALIWALPVMFYAWFVPSGTRFNFLLSVVFLTLALIGFRESWVPFRRGDLSYGQTIFFGTVVPFLIWVAFVYAHLLLLRVTGS
jgi:hypothetical protein